MFEVNGGTMHRFLIVGLLLMLSGCALSTYSRNSIVKPAMQDDNQWMKDIQALSLKGSQLRDCKAGLANGLHIVSIPSPGVKLAMIELSRVADMNSEAYKACFGTAAWWIYKAEEAKSIGQKFVIPTINDAIAVLGGL
jgi:hypothetical protein